jgi:hypothetical protein
MVRIALATLLLLLQTPGVHLQSGGVSGFISNRQGIPITNTRVVLTPANKSDIGALEGLAQTDAEGRFKIDNIPAGRYHLAVGPIDKLTYHPGVEDPARATIINVTNGTVTPVPVMMLSLPRVRGRIIDAKTGLGQTIESLVFASGIEVFKPAMHHDGSFSLLLSPGTYVVIGNDPAMVPFSEFVTVPEGPLDGLRLKASRLPEVQGTFADKLGRPVSVHSIFLRADPSNTYADGNMSAHNQTASADANGVFAFPAVLPGKYMIEVRTTDGNTMTVAIQVGLENFDIRVIAPCVPAIDITC